MERIKIDPKDNVEVAVIGENQGHKFALRDITCGENIIKYGCIIGHAITDIKKGDKVHVDNIRTNLRDNLNYTYEPNFVPQKIREEKYFMGYEREKEKVGIRNEILIIPTVGCVNSVVTAIEKQCQSLIDGTIDGVFALTHPYGCSQLGSDHLSTQMALAGLVKHPNAGGVLVVALGCENNTLENFKSILGDYNEDRVKFITCQDCEDEIEEGVNLVKELMNTAKADERVQIPINKLIVGLKCGGSDGLSGITANPLVGSFSDELTLRGGTAILTEVPEMFGAETILMNRCIDKRVFEKTVNLINDFKDYFTKHGQTIYENPSPGNKAGGISTLEDKSLGCTQKSGTSPVVDVLEYGEQVKIKGLNLLNAPGNDLVAATALAVSGAHIVLFTTGRGTPFGAPVTTVKISSNSPLSVKKDNWIDFNAGELVNGVDKQTLSEEFLDYVISVASGEKTKSEKCGVKDLAIWKNGITL